MELLLLLWAMMLMCSVPVNEHKSTQYPPPPSPVSKSSSLPALLFRRTIGNADVAESDGERWKLTSPIAMVMLRGVADDVIVVVVWRYNHTHFIVVTIE